MIVSSGMIPVWTASVHSAVPSSTVATSAMMRLMMRFSACIIMVPFPCPWGLLHVPFQWYQCLCTCGTMTGTCLSPWLSRQKKGVPRRASTNAGPTLRSGPCPNSTNHGTDHGIIATIITPQHDDAKRHDNRHTITISPTGYHDTTIISRNRQSCQPETRLRAHLHNIFTNQAQRHGPHMATIVHSASIVHTRQHGAPCVHCEHRAQS